MDLFPRVVRFVEFWLARVALVAMLILMFLVTGDVTLRYLANSPIKGTFELSEVLMVTVVSLTIAYTMRVGGHVSIDFIVSRLPPRIQSLVESFTLLLVLGVSSVILWQSALQARSILRAGETTGLLRIPTFPFRILIPLAMFFLSLEVLIQLVGKVRETIHGGGASKSQHPTQF